MKILVTGSNGFVGKSLVGSLSSYGHLIRGVVREHLSIPNGVNVNNYIAVGSIDSSTNWGGAMSGIDVVVHLAARVHVMNEIEVDPLKSFCEVNLSGTENLAKHAAAQGVKRFVYVSSIKVNGETTEGRAPFSESDTPSPEDPYGVSKWRAEQALWNVAKDTGLEVVIIRPPLVYGPGVKANFLSMMRWVNRGVPLPLGGIHNRRSLLALDNLVDLIRVCIEHPAAANQTFLAADGEDLSTTELLERLAVALGKPVNLFQVPPWLLNTGASLLGKRAISQRLCSSLQVSVMKANSLLSWTPPLSVDEGLIVTARQFLESQSR